MRLGAFIVVVGVSSVCFAQSEPQSYRTEIPYQGRQTPVGIELEPQANGGYRVRVDLGNGRVQSGPATVNSDKDGVLDVTVALSRPTQVHNAKGILQSDAFNGGQPGSSHPTTIKTFEPTTVRFKLARKRNPPLKARFYDGETELGRGNGQVDWDREVERRTDEALSAVSPGERLVAKQELESARKKRREADSKQINSKDPVEVAKGTDRLVRRLADLQTREKEARPGTPESKLLSEEIFEAKQELDTARKKRREADSKQINQPKNPVEVAKGTDRLVRRLADLQTREKEARPGTPESKLLSEEIFEAKQELDAARKKRREADAKQINQPDNPVEVAKGTDRLVRRLADLQTREKEARPGTPESKLLSEEIFEAKQELDTARKKRREADAKQINQPKNPVEVAKGTDRLVRRLADLQTREKEARPGTPESKLLSEEIFEAKQELDAARKKRREADSKQINSKDPVKVAEGAERLGRRLQNLQARNKAARPGTPESKLLSEEIFEAKQELGAARKKRRELDALQIQSGSLLLVNTAGKRLSKRLTRLRGQESRYTKLQRPVPSWLSHDLMSTESDLTAARKAKAKLTQ